MTQNEEMQFDDPAPGGRKISDHVAREAAIMLRDGRIDAIGTAIDIAMDEFDARPGQRPSKSIVRKHIQAMTMQDVGDDGYRALTRRIFEVADDAMTTIELAFDDVECSLVGRAALGYHDGGVNIHIRMYTDRAADDIAELLEERGYDEVAFNTADTRYGRMNQILASDDGQPLTITRIPLGMRVDRDSHLFKDKPMNSIDRAAVRARIDELTD